MPFTLQSLRRRTRTLRRLRALLSTLCFAHIALSLLFYLFRRPWRWWQLNTGTPRFREPDRNRLLGRSCTVLALTNVLDLFAQTRPLACSRIFLLVCLAEPVGVSLSLAWL